MIGGGFSGAAVVIQLLRRRFAAPTRILLIDRAREAGRGMAYAVRDYPYLLNVPAAQMSLYEELPLDFLEFARGREIAAASHDFLQRSLYGDYLGARLAASVASSAQNVQFVRVVGEAIRVHKLQGRRPEFDQWNVVLADGRDLLADDVVLALGNPEPQRLAALREIADSAAYVHDPWNPRRPALCATNASDRVLLLGTGLTMVDIALRLTSLERPPAELHALSRHGLLPTPQSDFNRCAVRHEDREVLARSQSSLVSLAGAVRSLALAAAERGDDWRSVIALVRNQLPALWPRLTAPDRRRFLRHLRPYWDAHRHRLPSALAERLRSLCASGALKLNAGRLLFAEPLKKGVQVLWQTRSRAQQRVSVYDRVINCTGPDYSVAHSRDPLVRTLLTEGLITPDALGLGIETTDDMQVIGRDGQCISRLYYLGPWLRSRFWEANAVPELRSHAERLAAVIAGQLYARRSPARVSSG